MSPHQARMKAWGDLRDAFGAGTNETLMNAAARTLDDRTKPATVREAARLIVNEAPKAQWTWIEKAAEVLRSEER